MRFLFFLQHFSFILGFRPFEMKGENRFVPSWTDHLYSETSSGQFLIREYVLQEGSQRTYLLCPRGYFIGQITTALYFTPNIMKDNPELSSKMGTFTYSACTNEVPGDKGDRLQGTEMEVINLCPSLHRCLLYQACVFNFGNEFCMTDPAPGFRKNIDTNVTCVADQSSEKVVPSMQDELKVRKDLVNNILYTSNILEDNMNIENTVLEERHVPEEVVFHGGCPQDPYRAGFRGNCGKSSINNLTVVDRTWHLNSRIKGAECQRKVEEVFCAFQFDSLGRCVPPHLLVPNRVRAWFGGDVWAEQVHPQTGQRPQKYLIDAHREILSYSLKSLVPVRIGFAILVHKDVPAVIQMIKAIYRLEHFYAIHVDYRKQEIHDELRRHLALSFPSDNIRLLPQSRSHITSWGSFQIVRAQLELYEELMRMGIWDFTITMSGSDLPIRNIDDLGYALSPYRGSNFFGFHQDHFRNSNLTKDQGLCMSAWYSCDGFTYNVTQSAGQPTVDVLQIKTGSQWSVLSREFVDYVLNTEAHNDLWRTFDFHMQTSVIPDESYLSTMAMNSKFKNSTHRVLIYWIKKFSGKDKYNLCKHLDDADFCGQGPSDIEESDMGDISNKIHRYFFARKFPTNDTNSSARKTFINLSDDGYRKMIRKYVPPQIIHQLMQNAANYLDLVKLLTKPASPRKLTLAEMYVFPKLHSGQPCCSLAFDRHFASAQEYSYVMDFEISTPMETKTTRVKYNLEPQSVCYPAGDLRAIRATGWVTKKADGSTEPLVANVPFPYHPAGISVLHAEIWFHRTNASVSAECKNTASSMSGDPVYVENIRINKRNSIEGDSMFITSELVDPQGKVRCTKNLEVEWNRDSVRDNGDGDRVERSARITMDCGAMEAGKWRLRLYKTHSERPYIYEMVLLLLPSVEELGKLGPEPDLQDVDLLQGMWSLDSISLLPLKDFYKDDVSRFLYNLKSANSKKDEHHHKEPVLPNSPDSKQSAELGTQPISSNLLYWLTCQGGLVALSLIGLISINLFTRSRQYRAVYKVLMFLLVTSLIQITLCSWLCTS